MLEGFGLNVMIFLRFQAGNHAQLWAAKVVTEEENLRPQQNCSGASIANVHGA